jgi:hypothetical protein
MDRPFVHFEETPPPGSRQMTQHRAWPCIERGSCHAAHGADARMAYGIDAGMDTMQALAGNPTRDACRGQADLLQLLAFHDPPLAAGKFRQSK